MIHINVSEKEFAEIKKGMRTFHAWIKDKKGDVVFDSIQRAIGEGNPDAQMIQLADEKKPENPIIVKADSVMSLESFEDFTKYADASELHGAHRKELLEEFRSEHSEDDEKKYGVIVLAFSTNKS